MLRLFLIGLRSQLYVAGAPNISVKKPLNAFLGELFLSSWTDSSAQATTRLVVEQVSHHPPITAVHIASEEHGVRADGYARPEMTFNGAINIRQIGHTILRLDKFDEDYLLPFPDVQVRGFLSRCLYPELLGTYKIISSTGYVSEIKFSGTGVFSGTKNYFEARIYHKEDGVKSYRYKIEGVWSEGWKVKDGATGQVLETYDIDAIQNRPAPMNIDSVENQDPWESRRAWRDVICELEKNNFRLASVAKQRVEEAQRRMRREEKTEGKAWKPLFFRSKPGDEHQTFHRLAKGTDWVLSDSQTNGVWMIDEGRLNSMQKPYRGDMTPLG